MISEQLERPLAERLRFAIDIAERAGSLILEHYQSPDLEVDAKGDSTPVTVADRGAEELIRRALAESFPDDGILGEEFPEKPGTNDFRWILDPIDGTKSFVHGVPLFGTMLGLEQGKDNLVLGVVRFPALDEVVYAANGGGAWWQIRNDTRKVNVRDNAELSQATFCTTTLTRWSKIGKREAYEQLIESCSLCRGWGDCYGHILVATGRADVMIDPALSEWDAAALVPILREAGGQFIDWDGNETIYSGNGLSVSAAMRERILSILGGAPG